MPLPPPSQRKTRDVRDLAWFVWLLPRNAGIVLIRAYRAVVSPLYGDVCRYYPSCSAYGLGAVQHRGLVVGSALTAWRIVRCNPWSSGGVDDVPMPRRRRFQLTRFGFVVPAGWVGTGESSGRRARHDGRGRRRAARPAIAGHAHAHVHPGAADHSHTAPSAGAAASVTRESAEHDLSPMSRKD
jgi:putative membrane protein insertion efficiency factor